MGITGLLPFLKKATREVNISNFSGATVAIDAYCWLHKGSFSCAEKLGKGEATDGYVQFCVKMVNSLLAAGVVPILVFDGRNLPSKSVTEQRRRENKSKNKQLAKDHLRRGNLREAREYFQRCVEVTPQMALLTIKACRKLGVDCIVAPYEADAQLAYLNKCGIAQIVITEDSDLILFGCDKILYKMDANGNGVLLESNKLHLCLGIQADNFTFDKFRHMCILSGCDYLQSLPGIGLGKSCKFFAKATNRDLNTLLPKLPTYLKMPKLVVSDEYIIGFIKADNTFLYQLVFDPVGRKLIPLNPYPLDLNPDSLDYAGRKIQDEAAYQMALGNIDIETMEVVENFDPDVHSVPLKSKSWSFKPSTEKHTSIWSKKYSPNKRIIKTAVPVKKTFSTPLQSLINSRCVPVMQKRCLTELKPDIAELSNNDLTLQYGHVKKLKVDYDVVDPPMPVISRYFSMPTASAKEEIVPLQIRSPCQSLPITNVGVLPQTNQTPRSSFSNASPDSTDSGEHSITPDGLSVKCNTEDDGNSSMNVMTTPRGRLLFDRAMKTRTPLLSSSSLESNSGKQLSPASFNGNWKSLRSLFSFKTGGDQQNALYEKSPDNNTAFKPVVALSERPKTDCPLENVSCSSHFKPKMRSSSCSEEDLSPLDSQNDSDFVSDHGRTLSSKPTYQELKPVFKKGATKCLQKKCRTPGLTRKGFTTSHSTSTPKCKQLNLKETFAKFNYHKTQVKQSVFTP